MRKIGKATTAADLKLWSNSKLINEIAKQIRIDCGGQEAKAFLKNKAIESFGLSDDESEKIANFAYDFASRQLLGSRKRTRSKLVEISNRLDV